MKGYLAFFCMVLFAISCSKTNDAPKSDDGSSDGQKVRLETLSKTHGNLAVAEVGDSFIVKKGVLVEFKSYDDLNKVLGGVLKGYKDSIYLRYNPNMVQKRVMDECDDVGNGGGFAPIDLEGTSGGWPNYNVNIVLPTYNPFVTYGITFTLVPASGGCGYDLAGNPIPSYESISHNVHFYGVVPSCMTINDINGYSMYICSTKKVATTIDWVVKLQAFGVTLTAPMSYTHNHMF